MSKKYYLVTVKSTRMCEDDYIVLAENEEQAGEKAMTGDYEAITRENDTCGNEPLGRDVCEILRVPKRKALVMIMEGL